MTTTGGEFIPFAHGEPGATSPASLQSVSIVINAGPPGVQLCAARASGRGTPASRSSSTSTRFPPWASRGSRPTDKGKERHGVKAWGALGVGGTKMKIHKKAIQQLFTANTLVLDAEEVLELGRSA